MRNVGKVRPSDMHVSITFAGRAPALKHVPQCVFTPKHHLRMDDSIAGVTGLRSPQFVQIFISSTEMTVTSTKPAMVEPNSSNISAELYTTRGQRKGFHLTSLLDMILLLLESRRRSSPGMNFGTVFVIMPPLAGIWKISHSFDAKDSSVTDGFRCRSTCLEGLLGGEEQQNITLTIGSSGGPALSHLWPMNVDDGGGGRGPIKPGGMLGSCTRFRAC